MKVLEYNEIYLIWIGLLSKNLKEPTNDFLKSICAYIWLFGFTGLMLFCAGGYMYIYRDNITATLRAFLVLCAGLQGFGSYLSLGAKMKKIKRLHLDLQEIVDNCKSTEIPKKFLNLFSRFF